VSLDQSDTGRHIDFFTGSPTTQAKVRIGIDGRYMGSPVSGIPRYINELCKQLDILLPNAVFLIYAQRADGISLPSPRWEIRAETSKQFTRIKPNIWWKLRAGRLIRSDRLDVLWAGGGLLPGRAGSVPIVMTVHDLTFRLFPDTVPRFTLWAFRLFFRRDLLRANRTIANSEGTRNKLSEFYGRAADVVVRPAAAAHFRPASVDEQAAVRAQYALSLPFLLAVSTLEPRKNFTSLIEAFLLLKRGGKFPDHELVIIGKKGWKNGPLARMLASSEGRRIRSLGFVPDAHLPALYSACAVFCMPSLYEGFGIPVLEARRCGARVVTTDIPELREAGDEHCIYVSPDAASIAEGIRQALTTHLPARQQPATGSSWHAEALQMLPLLSNEI